MSYYDTLILKPLSLQILQYVGQNDDLQAKEIAAALEIGTRQVDAAVSKSLQRYGFIVRYSKLTPLKKKAFNVLRLTESGRAYLDYLEEKENSNEV